VLEVPYNLPPTPTQVLPTAADLQLCPLTFSIPMGRSPAGATAATGGHQVLTLLPLHTLGSAIWIGIMAGWDATPFRFRTDPRCVASRTKRPLGRIINPKRSFKYADPLQNGIGILIFTILWIFPFSILLLRFINNANLSPGNLKYVSVWAKWTGAKDSMGLTSIITLLFTIMSTL